MRTLALGVVAAAVMVLPANAGGILMCDQFHCRSVVEFPPPIVLAIPPVISTQRYLPPPPPPVVVSPPVRCRLWPRQPVPPGCAMPDPPRYANSAPPPARRSRPDVSVPPPEAEIAPREAPRDLGKAEIETDILDFCDNHPDERFCGKLGAYLRSHPEARPRP
jgi:hypothetical protein